MDSERIPRGLAEGSLQSKDFEGNPPPGFTTMLFRFLKDAELYILVRICLYFGNELLEFV